MQLGAPLISPTEDLTLKEIEMDGTFTYKSMVSSPINGIFMVFLPINVVIESISVYF